MGVTPSRKLAVILHADVVGSTALVRLDETLAHQRIQEVFRRFSKTIHSYNGTAHEIRGDALVAEFARASDAVSASLAFQAINAAHNEQLPDDIRPIIRVGIAMGEVVIADNTMTGEGVVLAQRLEQLAEPGGVVVQESVSEIVPSRLPFEFESMGKKRLKGFNKSVSTFAARLERGADMPAPDATESDSEEVVTDPIKDQPPPVPDEKPSIAVLPFNNMSGDPEQEYFSDGITEDIITALSKVSDLLVIARNSTFIYKGKAVDIKQVGRDQGVRFVLEGSVRKAVKRVRVTAQLIDASTGHHLWAERYDRDLEDIFAVQDEIMRKIVSALDIHIREGEQARFWSSGTENLEAWECVRIGSDLLHGYRKDDLREVMRLGQQAIELDPEYAAAWILMSWYHSHVCDDTTRPEEERKRANESVLECARHALEYDPHCAEAYISLGMYHLDMNEHEAAIENANKSVELAPNHAYNIAISAAILNKCGEPALALERMRKAMRLSPVHPTWFLHILGQASRLADKNSEAIDAYEKMVVRQPDALVGHLSLATIFGETNQIEKAKASATEVLRIDPDFSTRQYMDSLSYRNPAEATRFGKGLRKAGLPK